MTSLEMNIEFLRLLEAISKELVESEIPDTETIFQMLNISQIRYLKEIYFKDGEHQNILNKADELRDLVTRELVDSTAIAAGSLSGIASTVDSLANIAYTVDLNTLSDEFMFYIRSDSKVTRTTIHTCTAQWMPNEYIKYADKDKYITSPVNSPIIVKPGCYIENDSTNNLVILHDIYTTLETTDGVSIEFIKEPTLMTISVNCELPNFMHEDVVKFAVETYITNYKFKIMNTKSKDDDRTRTA